ncbi:uracil-DNA glycosylase [Paracoccus sp. Z330]|uniref:Uracil-DNA glycosylase n=1 Tax=Paracoccus onchidii TaxID=3017813 RepID=A0ABT4ZJN0_9RHOB|nr:uracil-DNA glycosylase [Paracoccus onchidii]MDB6179419.1 uracil-DNA glycosylase [Paracoccus onchidii]
MSADQISVPAEWAHLPFFRTDWPDINRRLRNQGGWLPGPGSLFAAYDGLGPQDTRVVILGQDPYPTPGHANGLAFSVAPEIALPRSLKNIFRELQDDLGAAPENGDLSHWAAQGVLLANTALSVPVGDAGGHSRWGWDGLVRQAIAEAQKHGPLAFVLWGKHAQKAVADLPRPQDLVIATAHPSPLSARRGFFGSRPFSRVNRWLQENGRAAIAWAS